MPDFTKIPCRTEYHINKLLVDDGYSNALDPDFKPIVLQDEGLAIDTVCNLPKECYLAEVLVPQWK